MNIEDKIKKLNEGHGNNFRKNQNFIKMEEFYQQAIESGLIKKPEYTLPPMDTIGARFYRERFSLK